MRNYIDEPLHVLIMRVQARLERGIMSGAGELGISSGQPRVLQSLLKYDRLNNTDIAYYCEKEQATIGTVLNRMEKLGLITKTRGEDDRRCFYTSLSDLGRKKALELNKVFEDTEKKLTDILSEEEAQELDRILNKILDNIE